MNSNFEVSTEELQLLADQLRNLGSAGYVGSELQWNDADKQARYQAINDEIASRVAAAEGAMTAALAAPQSPPAEPDAPAAQ